jgi:hypothetical protein
MSRRGNQLRGELVCSLRSKVGPSVLLILCSYIGVAGDETFVEFQSVRISVLRLKTNGAIRAKRERE